jgi:hypothetical protein
MANQDSNTICTDEWLLLIVTLPIYFQDSSLGQGYVLIQVVISRNVIVVLIILATPSL